MARRCVIPLVLLVWIAFGLRALAHPIQSLQAAPVVGSGASPIRLDQSVVLLAGPWRFHVGDSPTAQDGDPAWAEPGFDDSE